MFAGLERRARNGMRPAGFVRAAHELDVEVGEERVERVGRPVPSRSVMASRPLLEKFLQLYTRDDGFTRAARRALQRIQYGLPSQSGNRVEH
jgi:hypothetical protein